MHSFVSPCCCKSAEQRQYPSRRAVEGMLTCSRKRRPPKRKHMPRIRSKLARIDPSNEAWTIRISSYQGQQGSMPEIQNNKPFGVQCYSVRRKRGEHRSCTITTARGGTGIWDAIDMIMPLRGLLALSCLVLGRHTCWASQLGSVPLRNARGHTK